MTNNYKRQKGRGDLNRAINELNLMKEVSNVAPVKATFDSVVTLLTMVRVSFLLLYDGISQAHTARTQWLTKWITSSSDYYALQPVESLSR